MKFRIGDREYEFDGNYTLAEAMLFFDKASIGMAEVQGALARGNPYATTTMMFILKKRAGEAVRWQDMQAFSILDFQYVPEDDDTTDPDGEPGDGADESTSGEAPDPTKDAGMTPDPGTATSS